MAGTLVANTINTDTGLFSTNNAYLGIAKAWVYFSCPSSTVTVNSSFNISSVTRSSTGIYVINFATAFSDANYSMVSSASPVGVFGTGRTGSSDVTASAVTMYNGYFNGSSVVYTDTSYAYAAFFHS